MLWHAIFRSLSVGCRTDHCPNDQSATTLWCYDHAIGITRLNIYVGLTGFASAIPKKMGLTLPETRMKCRS